MAHFHISERETSGIRSFTQLIRPWSKHIALIILLVTGLALADMVLPWALSLLVDDVFPQLSSGEGGWELLAIILVSLCVIYVFRNVLFFVSRMISVHVSEQVCFNLRQRLFNHLQQLGMNFYKSNRPGQISSRVMDDTFRIQTFIQDKLPTLLRYFLEFQILLILLYVVNWKLALASTVVLPLHLWTYKKFYLPIRDSHHRAQKHLAQAHGNLIETFLGVQVIKGFSAEQRETESFLETIRAGRDDQIKTQRFQFAQKVVADLLVGVGTVLLLGYGAWEVYAGTMSIGLFLMFFWYVRMLYPAVLEIISGTGHFSRTSASVDRVLEMLKEPVDEISYDMRTRTQMLKLVGPIEFKNVSFLYEEDESPVLKNINLLIDAGEHVVITGPSGCGKSTFISLLPRFNDPTSGLIKIGGHDIKDIRLQDVRDMFGVAFQDAFLFNASIYDNLRYARPTASTRDVVNACKLTGAHTFIERLPEGYDTRIGERGIDLSHGQKQRINLARALVRQPQTLIIDETTASIEADAAIEVIKDILEHMAGRTVIIVTHDPNIKELVNRVITLEHRTITQDEKVEENNMKHPAAKQTKLGILIGALLCSVMFVGGCSSLTTTSMLELSEPKSSGITIESDEPVNLVSLADAVDELIGENMVLEVVIKEQSATPLPTLPTPSEIADLVGETVENQPTTLSVDLPKLNKTELDDLVQRLTDQYGQDLDYAIASNVLDGILPPASVGISELQSIAKKKEGTTKIIRFGYQTFLSQPTQLWVEGFTIVGNEISANADASVSKEYIAALSASLESVRANLGILDLDKKIIQLSYIDSPNAIKMLDGLGFSTFADAAGVPDVVDWSKLPYIVSVPEPADTGLVGGTVAGGAFGLTIVPNTASQLSSNMVASPTTQLVVFFDPAHPEQYGHVKKMLGELIDRPARQIFIEGLVLEINEDGLKDIGIDWHMFDANDPTLFDLTAGKTNAGTTTDTLVFSLSDMNFERAFTRFNDWWFDVDVRALIRDGKAEILSRPSVLTLNNRQATIRVGQDIPIATSTAGLTNADMLAFNFKYLPTGIMLNVRPRISADGSEVSMLIDTIVSSTVPGADLELRGSDDEVLASAPTISSRRVQTYGRIPNNTPFIIGGLVNREHHTIHDKVPLLGDLPLIGSLFRADRTTSEKTEVIIVLTPHVLPESSSMLSATPKDDPRFDDFGNELFRDSYRIRDRDVFDLSFLKNNKKLHVYRDYVTSAIENNFRLSADPAFRQFTDNHFPGEAILTCRMVYEVIKRLNIADSIPDTQLAFFKAETNGGMEVEFLDRALAKSVDELSLEGFFRDTRELAFVITFYENDTVPEVSIVQCPDRESWKNLTWSLNLPSASGQKRSTIVIQNEGDLLRVRRAVALKRFLEINSGGETLELDQFTVGQYVLVPDIDPKQIHIVDEDVAKYFFQTEHYYAATLQAIDEAIKRLDLVIGKNAVK